MVDEKKLIETLYEEIEKNVCEGDIIEDSQTHTIGVVRFGKYRNPCDGEDAEHYGFYMEWPGRPLRRCDFGFWMNNEHTRVIGNIIDNPERLRNA